MSIFLNIQLPGVSTRGALLVPDARNVQLQLGRHGGVVHDLSDRWR